MSEQKTKATDTSYKTQLTKVNETYLPMITNQLENNNITLSEYAKSCVANANFELSEKCYFYTFRISGTEVIADDRLTALTDSL